jgi:hypothetical protein
MSDLTDAALAEIYGYTATIDTTSYLTEDVAVDDLTVPVADAKNFSRGIVQIGDELMVVDAVDRATGALTLGSVRGRGVRGTKASAHKVGDRVTMSPTIPRFQAVNAVAETLRASSGLFSVTSAQIVYDPELYAYDLPAGVDTVLDVVWMPLLGGQWIPIRRWTHDRFQSKLTIGSVVGPGRTVRITYSQVPVVPRPDDDFTETGLPESCIDVIRLGAAWRLSAFLEPVSLMSQSAEADALKRGAYPTSRIKVSQFYFSLYQQRLNEEIQALQSKWPVKVHFEAGA